MMMKNLKNLTKYSPDEPALGAAVAYLRDEDGNDWYESQKEFSADTIKVAYDAEGVIRSVARDVSMLWPINLSVAEVSVKNAPHELSDTGEWLYQNGALVRSPDFDIQVNTRTRNRLLKEAQAIIAPLQDAVDLDMATDEEKRRLRVWKEYRVQLSRVDICAAPTAITLPAKPE